MSIHGWAFWFDRVAGGGEEVPGLVNVCVYCGAADEIGFGLSRVALR